jgi:hypothetical protein
VQEAQKSVAELVTYVCNTTARMPEAECEVLYGRAGLLYALLFVERCCPQAEISSRHFQKLIQAIVTEGKRCGEHLVSRGVAVPSPPFMHLWHKKPYLGAAHGTCGILHVRSSSAPACAAGRVRRACQQRADCGRVPSVYVAVALACAAAATFTQREQRRCRSGDAITRRLRCRCWRWQTTMCSAWRTGRRLRAC